MTGDEFEGEYVALPAPIGMHRPRPTGEISLPQVLAALWRRKILILSTMILLGLVGFIAAQQATPKFLSQGVLAIDSRPTQQQRCRATSGAKYCTTS